MSNAKITSDEAGRRNDLFVRAGNSRDGDNIQIWFEDFDRFGFAIKRF
ncbi:MAG: hypothetical protein ABI891_01005 [Acidobacteriota bacterium]